MHECGRRHPPSSSGGLVIFFRFNAGGYLELTVPLTSIFKIMLRQIEEAYDRYLFGGRIRRIT